MNQSYKVIIYVQLLNEGVPVARPTYGERIDDNLFRVLPTDNYDPEDETWEFPPNTIVRCERRGSPEGKEVLLAVAVHA
jgi:hypothetical protein